MKAEARSTEVRYHHSASFPTVLEDAGCALLVSTYQAGQLVAVGVADGGLSFSFRRFDHAMGVAVGADRVVVGGKDQVWTLTDHPDVAAALEPEGRYDHCWLPRSSVFTGAIQCHEVVWGTTDAGEPDLWVVNTSFSCLAGLDQQHSFVPRWTPPYISRLAPEDRCHLNGVAMRDGRPAYVTVMARSDEPGGWRAARNETGTVLDVPSGEVVTTGLAMPHSPRWHEGELYVLNSGYGRLERVDPASGRREVVAAFPGYARGLACHGDLAFVGLSKIRETTTFGGTPLAAYHDQLKCGVGVVDLRTGETVATMEWENGVDEIFDVQVVPGARCPVLGPPDGEATDLWLLPASVGPPATSVADGDLRELAGRGLRDLVDDHELIGDPPRGDPPGEVVAELGYVEIAPGAARRRRRGVRPSARRGCRRRGLEDVGVGHDLVLELDRGDPLAARTSRGP